MRSRYTRWQKAHGYAAWGYIVTKGTDFVATVFAREDLERDRERRCGMCQHACVRNEQRPAPRVCGRQMWAWQALLCEGQNGSSHVAFQE